MSVSFRKASKFSDLVDFFFPCGKFLSYGTWLGTWLVSCFSWSENCTSWPESSVEIMPLVLFSYLSQPVTIDLWINWSKGDRTSCIFIHPYLSSILSPMIGGWLEKGSPHTLRLIYLAFILWNPDLERTRNSGCLSLQWCPMVLDGAERRGSPVLLTTTMQCRSSNILSWRLRMWGSSLRLMCPDSCCSHWDLADIL